MWLTILIFTEKYKLFIIGNGKLIFVPILKALYLLLYIDICRNTILLDNRYKETLMKGNLMNESLLNLMILPEIK